MTADNPAAAGLAMIRDEMSRQHADARQSLIDAAATAALVGASVRRTRRLLLLGMGGSHCVNRSAAVVLRQYGIDAAAVVASEYLYAPYPAQSPPTRLLTSQSGESAEIARLLEAGDLTETFGLTLDPESRLARTVPSLVGYGGVETAYAATRSLTVSLTLFAAIAEALGHEQDAVRAVLASAPMVPVDAATRALSDADAVIFSGRTALTGIAEAGALGLLELARMPAFALEGGQFRHGPVEALRAGIGVVLMRADDDTAGRFAKLAGICVEAGAIPVVFDCSGRNPLDGCITLPLPRARDFAAALVTLPTLQALAIEIAKCRVANVGEPVRSQKVTRSE